MVGKQKLCDGSQVENTLLNFSSNFVLKKKVIWKKAKEECSV